MFEKKIFIQQRLRIRSQHALPTKSLILAKNFSQITNTQDKHIKEISHPQFNEDTNVHKRQNLAGNIQTNPFDYKKKTANSNASKFTATFPDTFQIQRFKSSNYINTDADNEQIMSDHFKKVDNSKHNFHDTRSRRIISQHRNSDKSSSSNSKKYSHKDKNFERLRKYAHKHSLGSFQEIKVIKSFDEEIDMFFDEMFNFGQKPEVKTIFPQQKHCQKHKQECKRHETIIQSQKIEKESHNKLVIIVLIICSTLAIIQILY